MPADEGEAFVTGLQQGVGDQPPAANVVTGDGVDVRVVQTAVEEHDRHPPLVKGLGQVRRQRDGGQHHRLDPVLQRRPEHSLEVAAPVATVVDVEIHDLPPGRPQARGQLFEHPRVEMIVEPRDSLSIGLNWTTTSAENRP